jgi:hypothetical protein
MDRYQSLFQEMSVDKLRQEVTKLYNEHKGQYKDLSELIEFIMKKLHIDKGTILQILQSSGEE